MTHSNTLLICTVGGSPEPLVVSWAHWRPIRVAFACTTQSLSEVDGKIVPAIRELDPTFDAGRYDQTLLSDGQDLQTCLEELSQLSTVVNRWKARGESFSVVVDFTGGTKVMSAALGIHASRWPCQFSYVGGTFRTKDGLGIVEFGSEKVVHQTNPWDALGKQVVDEFVLLLDQGAYHSATSLAEATVKVVSSASRKREFATLGNLAKALAAWERFDHKDSVSNFGKVLQAANDLKSALGEQKGQQAITAIKILVKHLEIVKPQDAPSGTHVLDLIANAVRRKHENRLEDGLARLYRATECIAQVALKERHDIASTAEIPLDSLPEVLRAQWSVRAREGVVRLGLQDDFELLAELEDELGRKFRALGLGGSKSPLAARNQSILAHGFSPSSAAVFDQILNAVLDLASVNEDQLPTFPKLGGPEQ